LRSIVRQDPDIILVGEIRDNETAEIAINAALTGHLLLSTFHANDAATAIPRLLDMNIEPFLLASTLEVIVAQRLVRKLCESCRVSVNFTESQLKNQVVDVSKYFNGKEVTLYHGKGCKSCNYTGFSGRSGIFEFIKMTTEMKNLILQNPSTQQIWQLAKKQGTKSLFEDGIEKVKNGLTTIEELLRVAVPEELTTITQKTEKKQKTKK
jgi:type II secretory ATPase GspE/PulE/Tfp pilus assembly ATPase PilB-like protein